MCVHHYRNPGCIAPLIMTAVMIMTCAGGAISQTSGKPSVVVQVLDEQNGVIVGAHATLTDSANQDRSGITNDEGKIVFPDLQFGSYTLRISAEHFRTYTDQRLRLTSGPVELKVTLRVAGVEENIAVFPDSFAIPDVEYIGGSFVIRGNAITALEGTGGLEALLRALAVRTSGPFGPVALVNGFEDSQLPPTFSIREIRINDNPYSAEYSTHGLGRIEILTKPGSDKLHGVMFGQLGNTNLNSRNPFAENKVRYDARSYGGNISGPVLPKRATFFIDFNRQQVDTNAVINATVVDSTSIVPLQQAVVTPQLRNSLSPRLDYQMDRNHTWVLRYGDTRSRAHNSSVGEFSLPSRAQNSAGRVQTFQVTETAVLSSKLLNEIRLQHVRTSTSRDGNNSIPTINVPGAFTGGGAEISTAYNRQQLSEVQDVLSFQAEKHIIKAGLQWRRFRELDGSTQNFGGTYTFASRIAPDLDANNRLVTDARGLPVMVPITTIEAYRRTVLFRQQGLSPAAVRQLGGGASQFSVTTGSIETPVQQYQLGTFVQDDWRLHRNFTLSGGFRLEGQSNDSRKVEFAPRAAFAWGIGGGSTSPRTVVRGGAGVFYDRINDRSILRSEQMDGVRQRQYFISDNSILDLFPSVPTPNLLANFAVPQATVRLANDLRSPYTVNTSLALERRILPALTVAATVSRTRSVHLLRSRAINAPLPGTYVPGSSQPSIRPFGISADIFQYESTGIFEQRQVLLNLVYRAGKHLTLWSTYSISRSQGDMDSSDAFPANSYDLRAERSRALQPRHTFYWGGWIQMKGGIELTPLVLWRSNIPFDITTGNDTNGDSIFTDRPAFATDLKRSSVVVTRFGAFDLNPLPGQQTIPRNFGNSPNFFIANLRVGRNIHLSRKVSVTLAVQGTNIFNHTNPGTPVGNLGSPLFGNSNTSAGDWGFGSNQAGNRRLETMLYFIF